MRVAIFILVIMMVSLSEWVISEKKMLRGYHRCTIYVKGAGDFGFHPDTMMSTCKIENICLTTGGKFVLFQQHDRILPHLRESLLTPNAKPWVITQGRIESNRGLFSVGIEDGDLDVEYGANGKVVSMRKRNQNSSELLELDPSFAIIGGPSYALHRFAAGNLVSNFLENLNMVVTLMMNYFPGSTTNAPEKVLNNHIVYLDDVFDMEGEEWKASFNYPPQDALRFSTEAASLFTSNPVLQMCKKTEGFRITNSPCRNENFNATQSKIVLQTCFSELYVGLSVEITKYFGREMMFVQMRNLAYSTLQISPHTTEENSHVMMPYIKSKDLLVAVQYSTSDYYGSIANSEEIVSYIQKELEKDLKYITSERRVIVELVNITASSLSDTIRYLSNVDVFISDQGNAAMGIFMRENTALILAPLCTKAKCVSGPSYIETFPHVHVHQVFNLGTNLKCIERKTNINPQNCDPVLPDIVYPTVLSSLKTRYAKYI